MKRSVFWLVPVLLGLLSQGCDFETSSKPVPKTPEKNVKKEPTKRAQVGKNIFLEVQGNRRRVLVNAEVCLRRGPLELLLTRTKTKEHEAILAADVEGRELKRALLAAGLKSGEPVKFEPKYRTASGDKVKISLVYADGKGKMVTVPAQKWILNNKTKKPLDSDWVFGGSQLVPNVLEPNKPVFLANEGDIVCISNFESALLDLPVKISKANDMLIYECNTPEIPAMGTKVTVVFESTERDKTK